jgi:hypothetical protein
MPLKLHDAMAEFKLHNTRFGRLSGQIADFRHGNKTVNALMGMSDDSVSIQLQ